MSFSCCCPSFPSQSILYKRVWKWKNEWIVPAVWNGEAIAQLKFSTFVWMQDMFLQPTQRLWTLCKSDMQTNLYIVNLLRLAFYQSVQRGLTIFTRKCVASKDLAWSWRQRIAAIFTVVLRQCRVVKSNLVQCARVVLRYYLKNAWCFDWMEITSYLGGEQCLITNISLGCLRLPALTLILHWSFKKKTLHFISLHLDHYD